MKTNVLAEKYGITQYVLLEPILTPGKNNVSGIIKFICVLRCVSMQKGNLKVKVLLPHTQRQIRCKQKPKHFPIGQLPFLSRSS